MKKLELISKKYNKIKGVLDERSLRIWCAVEAEAIGRGGITLVHKASGVSRVTISKGIKELRYIPKLQPNKLRKQGGGRKKLIVKDRTLLQELERLVTPATRGDPERALLWSSKSTYKLAAELAEQGYKVSQRSVYNLLTEQDYSLKSNRKTKEGSKDNPDRGE